MTALVHHYKFLDTPDHIQQHRIIEWGFHPDQDVVEKVTVNKGQEVLRIDNTKGKRDFSIMAKTMETETTETFFVKHGNADLEITTSRFPQDKDPNFTFKKPSAKPFKDKLAKTSQETVMLNGQPFTVYKRPCGGKFIKINNRFVRSNTA
jgi:hypothetical protein